MEQCAAATIEMDAFRTERSSIADFSRLFVPSPAGTPTLIHTDSAGGIE
jgi:hypothetical protein